MVNNNSVSHWLQGLKEGDLEALNKLLERYLVRVANLADARLANAPRGMTDGDDIAQSVLYSLYRGATAGRLADLRNRDQLWWMLLATTKRKVINHLRQENALKRGGSFQAIELSAAKGETNDVHELLDQLAGKEPTPDDIAVMEEQCTLLLNLLRDDTLQKIACCRLEGYTVEEIAEQLSISRRGVERKLQLIRTTWSRHLSNET